MWSNRQQKKYLCREITSVAPINKLECHKNNTFIYSMVIIQLFSTSSLKFLFYTKIQKKIPSTCRKVIYPFHHFTRDWWSCYLLELTLCIKKLKVIYFFYLIKVTWKKISIIKINILSSNFGIFSYFLLLYKGVNVLDYAHWIYNILSQYEKIHHNISQCTSNVKIFKRGDLIQYLYTKHGLAEMNISLFFLTGIKHFEIEDCSPLRKYLSKIERKIWGAEEIYRL